MADYPDSVYAPRTKENIAGISYDPAKTTTGFAEDISYLENEVLAIIDDLVGAGSANGLKGAAASFKANWLSQHNANGTHKDLTTNIMTVGASDYDRLLIGDDGTSKGVLTKGANDNILYTLFNAYYDGTWHSYDETKHSWLYELNGNPSGAKVSWYVAQPGATPAWTHLIEISEAGSLLLKSGGLALQEGATGKGVVNADIATVSTSDVALIAHNQGGILVITGADATNKRFTDVVHYYPGQTPVIINAININAPAARTYTTTATYYLTLRMASDTYTVRSVSMAGSI